MSCFSYVKHGASLAVIWGHMSDEVSVAAEADLTSVKDELRSNQTKRWEAIGMLKHIFSWVNLAWELKKHAINFLLCILEGSVSHDCQAEHSDCSTYMHTLYTALQAVEMVIIYASDTVLRKNAFDAFKKVLADIPSSLRFDILIALIKNSDYSSMIAIIMDCFKEEMHMEYRQRLQAIDNGPQFKIFWSTGVLELLEFVFRPPKGGPPSLPEFSDAVLSALNLYRFVLITESTGKTNYTGLLAKDKLQKACNEWFLPLRTLVTGIVAENEKDHDQLAFDSVCALNPVELVLYRCIELVEENLKHKV
ncbi:unnamed protein product [Ilex paraguariensis]|uniref:Aberrant root formation protein 4 n=1 Tax=Ilex paraguariensis TaxID=185542 RepID=A0ABC8RQN1_9AQUA